MPAGTQVYDASGNLILEITDYISKYLGSVSIAASDGVNPQSGTVTNSYFSQGTLWWLTTLPPSNNLAVQVTVSLSGTTLTWNATEGCPATTLFYGIY